MTFDSVIEQKEEITSYLQRFPCSGLSLRSRLPLLKAVNTSQVIKLLCEETGKVET